MQNTDDPEEVVLTAGKRGGKATIHLERKKTSEIDKNKVHHVAGGLYKGILINKAEDNLEVVEPPEGRLEFLAYLVDQDKNNEPIQDYWTLKFWFCGKADGLTKKRAFTEYFQDLMNPTNFPKNYVGFMKKALVLLKNYNLIKRVVLEVEQSLLGAPEDTLPPIKSFVSVFTNNTFTYRNVPEIPVNNKTFLTFMVMASADAHISLSAVYGDVDRKTYEIVIGADGNTKSMIRDGSMGKVRSEALTINVLSKSELHYFWISWGNHHVEVGRGAQYGHGRFLDWNVPPNRQFHVNSLAVATGYASHGQWEFAELFDPDKDFGKEAKKARVKLSLLWIARKQRMLQYLEEAYPNTIDIKVLLQQSKIKPADMITAMIMLKDLEKKRLIQEVDEGRWLRIQSGDFTQTDHEVKLVKDMPQLTGREQPTIAIITSLYCEKLAVDAMIEDKVTFVKYKTEGESQVYTVGQIGRFKVVSTKLSKTPGSAQIGVISAENTVTRLLGTFSKVEHVLLVGVGGGVPHYTDYSKHVRLGDVVVSLTNSKNDPLYIQCQKVEKIGSANGYTYNTSCWDCADRTLQNVVSSLRDITDSSVHVLKPWEPNIDQGLEILCSEESNFHRPSIKSDKLYYTKLDGTTVQVDHPLPTGHAALSHRDGQPKIHYGVVGTGKLIARTDNLKRDFAQMNNVKAFDVDFSCVLDSLEGNRNESFLIIRGIADYQDGIKKEWQPYAAVVAAAYMKSLIMAM
ncbi:hypothetical protein CHS0354_007120 [Potamilus streckersoni]|uniref:Farnesoic acid O-methyl transferase domain-containing protein n=1 Tax=Potamilus streckersoni TaxID=2493646 RepID=A0AAE0W5J8_9BIVA|nr:hypothetical protein CHS0354_007120 [Potamilus streckersoni]